MLECVNSYANIYYANRMQNFTPIEKCNGQLFTFVDWLKADRNPVESLFVAVQFFPHCVYT